MQERDDASGVLSLLGVVDGMRARAEHEVGVRVQYRSRSSPERTREVCESSVSPRPRSPSVSPDRRNRTRISQRAESAFFSSRPPPAPLRLIVRNPCVTAMAEALANSNATVQKAEHVSKNEQQRRSGNTRCKRHVKTLLRDLVATLPLTEMTAASSLTSDSCNAPLVLEVRHVAVQAITTSKAERNSTRNWTSKDEGEEWVGGVRALRDSHVRLVLRQLRHIERLNRALDRAAHATAPLHATPATALSLSK